MGIDSPAGAEVSNDAKKKQKNKQRIVNHSQKRK